MYIMQEETNLKDIVTQFIKSAHAVYVNPLGKGHINDSYKVVADGKLYYQDDNDNYWRMMNFIKYSVSYKEINPELAYRAGVAFGDFIRTGANTCTEDDSNLENVGVDLDNLRVIQKDT